MKQQIYDFIIIGGGPAGATISTLLSRKGYKVIVLEKEYFPRRHVGESMLSSSYFIFEDLGVLEEMKKRFVRKPGVVFSNSSGEDFTNWCFSHVISDDSWLAFHVRRDEFDKMLLDNSRKQGTEVWEGAMVTNVDTETDTTQVKVIGSKGKESEFELTGNFLIDASGQNSFLANKFKSKVPYTNLGDRVALYGHWMDIKLDKSLEEGNLKIVNLDIMNSGWMWMVPIDDNKLSIGTVIDATYFKNKRKELKTKFGNDWYTELYKEVIRSSSLAQEVIDGAQMSNTVNISSDYSYKNTNKFGSNYATIGDSSAFIDPIFASGVYLAMNGAYLLAEALDTHLKENAPKAIEEVYKVIDGAYEVIEQLIVNYYSKKAIKFNNMDKYFDLNFEKHRTAIQIFNLLISGKFFDAPNKFIKTINLLRDEKMLVKYKNLIGYNNIERSSPICHRNEAPKKISI